MASVNLDDDVRDTRDPDFLKTYQQATVPHPSERPCKCSPTIRGMCPDKTTQGRYCFPCWQNRQRHDQCRHCPTCGVRMQSWPPEREAEHRQSHSVIVAKDNAIALAHYEDTLEEPSYPGLGPSW